METFGFILLAVVTGCILWYYYPDMREALLVARVVEAMIKNNQAPTTFVIKKRDLSQLRHNLLELDYRIIIDKLKEDRIYIKVYHLQ